MTTANDTNVIATIAIDADALRDWKNYLKAKRKSYIQAGRIEKVRQILTVLNRHKDQIEFHSVEEVERLMAALEKRMSASDGVGSPYIQYYLRDIWAADSKGAIRKVLERKQGTNMEVHSTEEFDALIADLEQRIEDGKNRKANSTQRAALVKAREAFAPLEQALGEMEGALTIAQATESPEAARELLADSGSEDSDSDSVAESSENADSQPAETPNPGVRRAPENSEKPWRVYDEDGSFTEHESRKAAREANRARKAVTA